MPQAASSTEKAADTLRQRERLVFKQNQVLVKLLKEPLASDELILALQRVTEAAAATLEVARASVWLLEDEDRKLRCADLYVRTKSTHESGVVLHAKDYPAYFAALEDNRAIAAHNAPLDYRTREFAHAYLQPLGITSMLDATVRLDGRLVGVVCNEHTGPVRHWSTEEIQFASSLGDVVSLFLETRQRNAAQRRLRESEARFRALAEGGADAVAIVTDTGTITFVTPPVLPMLGYAPEEIVGRMGFELVDEQDLAAVRAMFERLLAKPDGREHNILRCRHKDGSLHLIECTLSNRLADPVIRGIISNFRDVTGRVQAENSLRQSEQRYRLLVENMTDVVWTADLDLNLTYISPSVERLCGWTSAERLSQPIEQRMTADAHVPLRSALAEGLANDAASTQTHRTIQHENLCKDGTTRWAESKVSFLRDAEGRATGLIGVTRDIEDRRLAEKALRESEQRHRSLFERNPAGVFRTTPEGEYLDCNDSLARMLGLANREELLQRQATEFYDDPGERLHWHERLAREGAITNVEMRYRRADGQACWVLANVSRLTGDGKHPIVYEGTLIDITERKRAEEELLRRNTQLAALTEIGQTISRLADPRAILHTIHETIGRVLDNRNFHIALYDETLGMIDFPLYVIEGAHVHRSSRPFQNGLTEHVLTTRMPLLIAGNLDQGVQALGVECYGRRPRCYLSVPMLAGEKILGVMTVQDYEHEGVYGVNELELLCTFAAQASVALENARLYAAAQAEIAERRQAEEALRCSEAKYRALVENLEQAVVLKDRHLRYVAANSRMCRNLGVAEHELVGKTDRDFYTDLEAERYRQDDLQVLQHGTHVEREEEQRQPTGQNRWVRVIKTPVRDSSGQINGVLDIFWDVTRQRTLETQLRHVQKMDAIGHLAGGIAHDFNNLLTAILGNVSLAQSLLPSDSPALSTMEGAEKASLRAAELVQKLLGFSRRTMLRLQPLDLAGVVTDTVQILRPALPPGIRVTVHANACAWQVEADPSHISQVLMNLCLNARDAMASDGELSLTLESVSLGPEALARHVSARPGDYVCLRVSDTGHGIPPEIRNRIFEPFFTTKEAGKGTGLGLAMVFGIVDQHRGWIECHSSMGSGTQFEVFLPRYIPTESLQPCLVDSPAPRLGHETILVIDDEPMVREIAQVILQRAGYRVLAANDGVHGLEVWQAARESIALVLLDLTMPRLSGQETLEHLVELDDNVRVLFTSGFSLDIPTITDRKHVLGFIGKPYQPDALARAVRAALDQVRPKPNLEQGAVAELTLLPHRVPGQEVKFAN
jgi:PAS domain S-box-containing protein